MSFLFLLFCLCFSHFLSNFSRTFRLFKRENHTFIRLPGLLLLRLGLGCSTGRAPFLNRFCVDSPRKSISLLGLRGVKRRVFSIHLRKEPPSHSFAVDCFLRFCVPFPKIRAVHVGLILQHVILSKEGRKTVVKRLPGLAGDILCPAGLLPARRRRLATPLLPFRSAFFFLIFLCVSRERHQFIFALLGLFDTVVPGFLLFFDQPPSTVELSGQIVPLCGPNRCSLLLPRNCAGKLSSAAYFFSRMTLARFPMQLT